MQVPPAARHALQGCICMGLHGCTAVLFFDPGGIHNTWVVQCLFLPPRAAVNRPSLPRVACRLPARLPALLAPGRCQPRSPSSSPCWAACRRWQRCLWPTSWCTAGRQRSSATSRPRPFKRRVQPRCCPSLAETLLRVPCAHAPWSARMLCAGRAPPTYLLDVSGPAVLSSGLQACARTSLATSTELGGEANVPDCSLRMPYHHPPCARHQGRPSTVDPVVPCHTHASRTRHAQELEQQKQQGLKLNPSQQHAMVQALTQRVALVQGPPGTGKSFVGALLCDIILRRSTERVLVVCYTNHQVRRGPPPRNCTLPQHPLVCVCETRPVAVCRPSVTNSRWRARAKCPLLSAVFARTHRPARRLHCTYRAPACHARIRPVPAPGLQVDQVGEALLAKGITSLVRVGGRSRSKDLEKYNLRELVRGGQQPGGGRNQALSSPEYRRMLTLRDEGDRLREQVWLWCFVFGDRCQIKGGREGRKGGRGVGTCWGAQRLRFCGPTRGTGGSRPACLRATTATVVFSHQAPGTCSMHAADVSLSRCSSAGWTAADDALPVSPCLPA